MVSSLNRYPLPPGRIIRRARDWRLYDEAGNRYTDFWQADGAAFLGHRPRGLARAVAAEIDRGLWTTVPTAWEGRLEKALAALARRIGASSCTIGSAPVRWWPLADSPRPGGRDGGRDGAWDGARDGAVHVTLPFPLTAYTTEASALPPVVLAGLVVAAGLLLRYLDSPEAEQRLELAGSLPSPQGYHRDGVYWVASGDSAGESSADYGAMRERAAASGIVLPPQADMRICCPGELGRRERERWEELCS